ncbi:MAG: prepilin peptidase [Mitsuaria chitosanitabida]|jgi:prepilin peptidase CpaA|uniref:A24 family peptidase n=1 Tax=Roseateles chitosanitabidus TaxID=65048 RepID=UPI001B181F23|nr:A24 family peptidase [Roseateles chitosanitabidus]MBO9686267.1 prepilin peptidase [Roseateles chitosanitabidus]
MQASLFTAVALATLAALLAGAAASDLRRRRVANRWLVAGALGALALHAGAMAAGQPALAGPHWWSPLPGAAAGLTLMLPLYLMRAMGAADVKLMAVVGLFLGVPTVALAVIYTMLAGGLLTLASLREAGVATRLVANLRGKPVTLTGASPEAAPAAVDTPLTRTAARLPYAVAIAMGTGAALLLPRLA